MIDVEAGDVIVAGTVGVYDTLYNKDITGVVVSSFRAGLNPKDTAQKIADLVRARALDRKRQSFRRHGSGGWLQVLQRKV